MAALKPRPLLVALALLAAGWLLTPAGPTPPLYDGVAYPDEPYRYVDPPHGAPTTKPPGEGTDTVSIVAGRSQAAFAGSSEQLPQVQVTIGAGLLTAPAGARLVHVLVQPHAPTSQPPDARIWGNVYRLTATSDHGPAQFRADTSGVSSIILRAPVGPKPKPVMEYNDGSRWRRLPIAATGNDLYTAPLAGPGEYAVATLPGQPQPVPGSLNGVAAALDRWILIPGIALALLIAAIITIRWTRTRTTRRTDPGQSHS